MQHTQPSAGNEQENPSEAQLPRSDKDIAAGEANEAARVDNEQAVIASNLATQKELEERPGSLRDWLMDPKVGEEHDLDWEADSSPDFELVLSTLLQLEAQTRTTEPNFTINGVSKLRQHRLIQQAIRETKTTNLASSQLEIAETETQATSEWPALLESVTATEGLTTVQQIDAILLQSEDMEGVDEERSRLLDYQRMLSLVPEGADRTVLVAKINSLDFSNGITDPSHFIAQQVFSYPGYDSGISEDTQTLLAEEFGIPKPPKIDTGSEAQEVVGEFTSDSEGRPVPVWPEDAPLDVRPGVQMYADGGRNQYLRAGFGDHVTRIDVTGWKGELVGKYVDGLAFVHETNQFGATGLLHSIFQVDFNLFGNEGFDASEIDRILSIKAKLYGGLEDSDGAIDTPSQRRGYLRYLMRLLNEEGDATGFSNNQDATEEAVKKLGLRNSNGSPSWNKIEAVGRYARHTYLRAEGDYMDLFAYLRGEAAVTHGTH